MTRDNTVASQLANGLWTIESALHGTKAEHYDEYVSYWIQDAGTAIRRAIQRLKDRDSYKCLPPS